MSKFIEIVAGAAEIAAGTLMALGYLPGGVKLGELLIIAGAGQIISGVGTILHKGPVDGYATTTRNPTAPWTVVYGRARCGGVVVDLSNRLLDEQGDIQCP